MCERTSPASWTRPLRASDSFAAWPHRPAQPHFEREFAVGNLAVNSAAGPSGNSRRAPPLLPLRSVLCFRGGLYGAPPGLVGAVPLDGGGKANGEVVVRRAPAELAAQLGAVDGVAAVVAGAVAHPVEVVLRPRVRMAHAADEWFSVLLQSRTLRPSP